MKVKRVFTFLHPMPSDELHKLATEFPQFEFFAGTRDQFPAEIDVAEAIALHWLAPNINSVLRSASGVRWIHLRGAGVDRIMTPELQRSHVVLTNGSGNHSTNIAEHVMALLLSFARQLPGLIRRQQNAQWQEPDPTAVFELKGQRLLIVGLGSIGAAVAQRAGALGMVVSGVCRSSPASVPPEVMRVSNVSELAQELANSDHVVIALPLTSETRRLFSREMLARIKPGAYLYNVGRGAVLDHDALYERLSSGMLAGAGLDVTDPEPLPASSPLWTHPNVIITSHSAGITPSSFVRYMDLLRQNLRRYIDNQPLLNTVDKELGY